MKEVFFLSQLAPTGIPLRLRPNRWDWIAFLIVFGAAVAAVQRVRSMAGPLEAVVQTPSCSIYLLCPDTYYRYPCAMGLYGIQAT